MRKDIKDWTILIYANGNNELEPEMWQSKIDAEKVGSSDNVNVVMELGRESIELVKIMRPKDNIVLTNELWTGVRQYYILKSKSQLINDLGTVNMADPHTLYDFITWGIKSYPAKRYMLILSGHGDSFVAALPDLSQDKPYAIGVTEMCKVINMIKIDTGSHIDILVLDICNMNSIEILYELGKNKINTVKTVLTYIISAPIAGMPCNKLIHTVKRNSLIDTDIILKNIIENIHLNLIGIKLNPSRLKLAKKIVNTIAYIYLTDDQYKKMGVHDLSNCDTHSTLYKYFLKLNKELSSMIVHYRTMSSISNSLIQLTPSKVFDDNYLSIYYKLSFAKNNYWFNLLGNKKINDTFSINTNTNLLPLMLQPKGLMSIIGVMNPDLDKERISYILKNLYKYKKWEDNINFIY